MNAYLEGVSHRCGAYHPDCCAGNYPHVQKVLAKAAFSSDGIDYCAVIDVQFLKGDYIVHFAAPKFLWWLEDIIRATA